jgi:putative ABC transport system ATP-binding protein
MQLRGKLSKTEIRKRATDLLTEVGLGDRLDHFPNMLSGGE